MGGGSVVRPSVIVPFHDSVSTSGGGPSFDDGAGNKMQMQGKQKKEKKKKKKKRERFF